MEDVVDFNIQVPKEVEQLDQLREGDSPINRGVDDVLDGGYTVPERWSMGQGFGDTLAEMHRDETIGQRIRQGQPEVVRDDTPWNLGRGECQVRRERAGWLMWVQGLGDEGTLGVDVGFSGGVVSAEEIAIHIIRDDQDEGDDF